MFLQVLNDVSHLTDMQKCYQQCKKLQLGPCLVFAVLGQHLALLILTILLCRDVRRCARPFSKGKWPDKSIPLGLEL